LGDVSAILLLMVKNNDVSSSEIYNNEQIKTKNIKTWLHYQEENKMVDNTINRVHMLINRICDELAEFLINKNTAYGNSALNPQRIFSNFNSLEQIRIRIDDKLSRIKNLTSNPHINKGDETLDQTKKDLIGYLILEQVAEIMNKTDEYCNK